MWFRYHISVALLMGKADNIVKSYKQSKGKKGKVVPMLNLIKHHAMKAYGGVDV
jgi:hypothetical protein